MGSAAECGGPARSLRECIFGRGLAQMERYFCLVDDMLIYCKRVVTFKSFKMDSTDSCGMLRES